MACTRSIKPPAKTYYNFGYIESTLAERPFFVGDAVTAADVDVMMTISLEMARRVCLLTDRAATQAAALHG